MSPKPNSSELEIRFATLWDAIGGSELVREYRFDKSRRWRADFAWEEARLLIEIEGGVWNRGRHLTPRGFMNDAEKYLAATLQGWAVIRLVDSMLTPDTIKQILDYARNRIGITIPHNSAVNDNNMLVMLSKSLHTTRSTTLTHQRQKKKTSFTF